MLLFVKWKAGSNEICLCVSVPVVQKDVRCPDLVCSESEVFHAWVLRLIPLQVVVIPVLGKTGIKLSDVAKYPKPVPIIHSPWET